MVSEEKACEVEPIEMLDKMSQEEFIGFAKMGYQYVMSDAPKIEKLHDGDVINLGGEFYELHGSTEDIIKEFYTLGDDEIRAFLLNEFAKIGVTLTFISLSKKDVFSKMDESGKPLSKRQMNEEMKKEMSVIDNTSSILRKMVLDKADILGVDPNQA